MIKYFTKKQVLLWVALCALSYNGLAQQVIAGNEIEQGIAMRGPEKAPGFSATISDTVAAPAAASAKQEEDVEMIPLGFGMERPKRSMTAAVGTVTAETLSRSSAINPANALYGRIAGLTVLENGGASWENDPTLFVRGVGTFRDASLLVLVDGFERPISSLSLAEIERVSILKDAAALAIYGLRGANGVVLVTTRRGHAKGTRVNLSYEHGITQPFRLPEFLNAPEYAMAVNQARFNDGLSPLYSQTDIDAFTSGSSPFLHPNVDWRRETFRDHGSMDNLNAAFEGSSKGVEYFALLNYQRDLGLLRPVNDNSGYSTQLSYQKLNFRTNLDIDLTKTTELDVHVGGNIRETNAPGSGHQRIVNAIYTIPSAAFPVKTYNGIWGGTSVYHDNPVALASSTGYGIGFTRELLADARLAQKLDIVLEGLSAEIAVAYDNSAVYSEGKTKQYEYEAITGNRDPVTDAIIDTVETSYGQDTELAYYSQLASQWRHATFQGNLKYEKEWGQNSINSILLFQHDKLVRNGRFNTFVHQLYALNTHYSNRGKYFAGFTVAYNGTNILPKNNRFGVFPAVSLGWKISAEDWFPKDGLFNDVKLRTSWGMTGNDRVPQNIHESKFDGAAGYYFTSNNNPAGGFMEGQLGSTDATFETSTKFNFGIDATLLGALQLTADAFYDRRENILVESNALISDALGVLPPLTTAGIMDNKGVEIGASWNKTAGDFSYHVDGQFSFVRNKIVAMGEAYLPHDYLKRTGRSYAQAFGLEAIGFFKDAADIAASPRQLFSEVKPGDIKYKDQNNDGVVNDYDVKPIGYNTLNPELYFSASIGMEYKGVGLNALFQGVGNHTIYLNTKSVFWPLRDNASITGFSSGSWTPETEATATLPRLSTLENANNYRPNNIWFANGAFFKLRSVEVYYNLPASLISKLKLLSTRIYVRGVNLFSIDKVDIVDPEAIGIAYPTLTSYNAGIKIGF